MPSISLPVSRYLVPFDPKRMSHYFVDVFVVGGGLAGLRAAMGVDSDLNVLIVTKDKWLESNSNYAQGGIASVLSPLDSFAEHVHDTMVAGGALCDQDVVEMVVRDGPQEILELISWGTRFDKDASSGEFTLGREGGHGRNRILHAMGDATGAEIMRAAIASARAALNLQMWEDTFVLDLLVHEGVCRGALIWNPYHGWTCIWAKQTILATGGTGQIYRETTNPRVATGDGHAIAYRAGAELRDMEFVQFHPTVLYVAGSSRSLVTEAARGEGAYLVDVAGHRFMPDYDQRAELAPRDIVSQSIVKQMRKTQAPSVFLDMSHLDADHVRSRFPGVAKRCAEFGIDIATDRIPVRPGAHYMMGGVTVDRDGQTTVPGLLAVGEVTSSGLHGANRLASNSLLENVVFGVRAARKVSEAARKMTDLWHALPIGNVADHPSSDRELDLEDVRNTLKSVMWRSVGVEREAGTLATAQSEVDRLSQYVESRSFRCPKAWELQNMILLSRMIIRAALLREESRGGHFRSDFPEINEIDWQRRVAFRRPKAED